MLFLDVESALVVVVAVTEVSEISFLVRCYFLM